ncbi:MAG: hypothetical protein KatS3mg002_0128 [Candidatus Woesearchaeota archaeon]|nr:MAG: hypothetical protein KatS3mg002_0128 [Candidatus Woesearchaeota archaeon]
MSITDKIKESYNRAKVRIKHPSLIAAKGLESILGFTAPIAGVLTIGADPSYSVPEKILYGPIQVSKGIYETIFAYISNTGVRDYVNGIFGEIFKLIGNAAQNVAEKPGETLATIIGAYALGKMAQYITKLVRESKEDKYLAQMK